MTEEINQRRRRLFGTAAMSIAVAQLGLMDSAVAQSGKATASKVPALKPGTNTSFKSMKQIKAGLLNVGYAEDGPPNGPPVLLCTAGPMTFTASSMSLPCSRRRAIA
jgi:hypothetical protein